MATSSIAPPTHLPPNTTTEPITIHRLSSHTKAPFNEVIQRFRSLVPQVDLRKVASQTSPDGIDEVIKSTGTKTDFVLFAEFNHGAWIRHFPVSHSSGENPSGVHGGKGLIRFIFGNPMIAITMIREDAVAGLHVPVECCFVEQEDGSTKMITMLPAGLIAGHAEGRENQKLRAAVGRLEEKVLALVGQVMQ